MLLHMCSYVSNNTAFLNNRQLSGVGDIWTSVIAFLKIVDDEETAAPRESLQSIYGANICLPSIWHQRTRTSSRKAAQRHLRVDSHWWKHRGNGKCFGCCSRWRGRRIYAKRKPCGGVFRGKAGNEVQATSPAFSVPQETKVLGGYCGEQNQPRELLETIWGNSVRRGESSQFPPHSML